MLNREYMIDQEKTGFESSRQVMNALKLLNSPYLPSNQRYESYLIPIIYKVHWCSTILSPKPDI